MATLSDFIQHYHYAITVFVMMAGLYIVVAGKAGHLFTSYALEIVWPAGGEPELTLFTGEIVGDDPMPEPSASFQRPRVCIAIE